MGQGDEVQISLSTDEAHWAPGTPASVYIVLVGTSCSGEVEPEPRRLSRCGESWPAPDVYHPDPTRDAPASLSGPNTLSAGICTLFGTVSS